MNQFNAQDSTDSSLIEGAHRNVVYTAYGQGIIFHFFVRLLSHCGFYMSANYMQHA